MQDTPKHCLNPKFKYKGPSNFGNSSDTILSTNYYNIDIKNEFDSINQYSFDSEPRIPEDSSKLMDKVMGSIRKQLKIEIGYLCFKGKMIWGIKELKVALSIKTKV